MSYSMREIAPMPALPDRWVGASSCKICSLLMDHGLQKQTDTSRSSRETHFCIARSYCCGADLEAPVSILVTNRMRSICEQGGPSREEVVWLQGYAPRAPMPLNLKISSGRVILVRVSSYPKTVLGLASLNTLGTTQQVKTIQDKSCISCMHSVSYQ